MTTKRKPYVVLATPVLLQGGTEYQMLSVIRALKGQDYRLGVLCYYEYNPSIVELFRYEGIEITLLGLKREGKNRLKTLLRLSIVLIKWFRRNKPDVVNVQYLAPGLIPILSARFARTRRILATIHISGSYAYGKKEKILLRVASFFAEHFICVSLGTEKFWFGRNHLFTEDTLLKKHKHFTIYNNIDTGRITTIIGRNSPILIREQYGINVKYFVMGIIGRLAEQKGHKVLFEALSLIKKESTNFLLLIIGTGPDEEDLKKLSRDLDIQDHIIWLGGKTQEEVFKCYSIINLLVMPSLYEGFGLVTAEAMAAGVPVIASNVDGLSELIENQVTGILVQPGNASELSKQIIKHIDNKQLGKQYSILAKIRVTEKFNKESFQKSCTLLYQTLLINAKK